MSSKMHKMLVDLISRKMMDLGYSIVASEGNYFPIQKKYNIQLPPTIIRHRPDIIGIDINKKRVCIGEAKTHSDLFSERTCEQLTDFSGLTNTTDNIEFIIGVPFNSQNLLTELFKKKKISAKKIFIVFLPEELVDDDNEDQI